MRVNGIDLHYIEVGAGEPLVLLMGFGGDHLSWGFQLNAFAAKHRVIAFDNRGSGRSGAPDVPYTTRLMADDAAALMDRLRIDTAHVLGVSMGTSMAGGYVRPSGEITPWLNELAFAPVDYQADAPRDEWSGDAGCGVQYFSQQGVARFAQRAGFIFDAIRSRGPSFIIRRLAWRAFGQGSGWSR